MEEIYEWNGCITRLDISDKGIWVTQFDEYDNLISESYINKEDYEVIKRNAMRIA